ncbi:hypothetical protein KI387_008214, partial [Taxus chinensis]
WVCPGPMPFHQALYEWGIGDGCLLLESGDQTGPHMMWPITGDLLEGLSEVDIIWRPYVGFPSYRHMRDELDGAPTIEMDIGFPCWGTQDDP